MQKQKNNAVSELVDARRRASIVAVTTPTIKTTHSKKSERLNFKIKRSASYLTGVGNGEVWEGGGTNGQRGEEDADADFRFSSANVKGRRNFCQSFVELDVYDLVHFL